MANPVVKTTPKGAWTKVATAVRAGHVWPLKMRSSYFLTTRLTGTTAPTLLTDALKVPPQGMAITAPINVDVYVYAKLLEGSVLVTDANIVPTDDHTGGVHTVSHAHHKIHEGDHYFISEFVTLASEGVLEFTIQTPDTDTHAHLLFFLQATEQTQIEMYEAVTESGGLAVTPRNNKRSSENTSGLTVKTGATVTATGTRLGGQKFGVAGNPNRAIGGDSRQDDEVMLKRNTKYLIRITSGAANNIVSYRAAWYEQTNVE